MNPRCRPRRRTRLLIKDEADVGAAFHMLAYCFFDILEETDSAKMQEYRSRVFPVVAQYGGKFLVIGGPIDSVERTWRLVFPVLRSIGLKETAAGRNERSRCFHGWRGDLGL